MENGKIGEFLIYSLDLKRESVPFLFSHPKESRFKAFFENLKIKKKRKAMSVDPKNIILGLDKRTSIIIKNIPDNLDSYQFRKIIYMLCPNIDFFYVPLNIRTRKKLRVAFVNVINYKDIVSIFMGFKYNNKINYLKPKIEIEVGYSRVQGKDRLFQRFFHEFQYCR